MKTYRFAGRSRGGAAKYPPESARAAWKARDPFVLAERALIGRDVRAPRITAAPLAAPRTISDALAFAKASLPPEPDDLLLHVWAGRGRQE